VFESAQREHEKDVNQLTKALNEANQRSKKYEDRARALDGDVNSVRGDLAAERSRMPSASCEAVRKHAETLSVTLGSCISEYSGMAREAQGYLSDVMLLEAAP